MVWIDTIDIDNFLFITSMAIVLDAWVIHNWHSYKHRWLLMDGELEEISFQLHRIADILERIEKNGIGVKQ
jgi:hypothetical protein